MSDQKRPFHEVIAQKLITAPVGITSDLRDAKVAELMMLLAILQESKMPATAAHKIAADNAGLPELLSGVGQSPHVAEFATLVLDDLKGREDEKKPEQPSTPRRSETWVDHDLPVHRGN